MEDPNQNNEEATSVASASGRQVGSIPENSVSATRIDWLNYGLLVAAACTVIGVALVWLGDRQDTTWIIVAGAVSFTISTIAWIGAFLVVSFKMLKMVVPSLFRWIRGLF